MNKLSDAAKLLGSVGGKHGVGKSKRRSKSHYRKMVAARVRKLRGDKPQE